ncbi:MAG: PP2C family serine/threonine-protein phosphatase [Cuspidothrix sp.]
MQCQNCGATVVLTDKFCEECGTALTMITQQKTISGCQKCGADIENIDEDGYCSQCGFRNIISEQERIEILINANLAGISDRGLRHHRNEDYLALDKINNNIQILVVCDGVSSSEKPEIAARTAAESTCKFLTQTELDNSEIAIKLAINFALKSISDLPIKITNHNDPPSTTIVTTLVKNGIATIGWLGDSRSYWLDIDNNKYQQLTEDDSWLREVVNAGEMTEIEAKKSPHAHAITRWLGADVIGDAKPRIINFKIPQPGYLLLCTDGLWNYVPEAEDLGKLIKEAPDKDAMSLCRFLVEFARECGGYDNITVGLLRVF